MYFIWCISFSHPFFFQIAALKKKNKKTIKNYKETNETNEKKQSKSKTNKQEHGKEEVQYLQSKDTSGFIDYKLTAYRLSRVKSLQHIFTVIQYVIHRINNWAWKIDKNSHLCNVGPPLSNCWSSLGYRNKSFWL